MQYQLLIRHVAVIAAYALTSPLYAQGFKEAKTLYYKGVEGDKGASRESTRILEKLAAEKPNDPLLTAYLASNKLLESGRTFALWNKNRLAKEGILGLDRAVKLAPENLEVRFIRAVSTYDLPSFFKRQDHSEADFEWLAPRVRDAATRGDLEKRLAAAALYYYGLIQDKKANRSAAVTAWRSAAALSPDTKAGQGAAGRLRDSGTIRD